MTQVTLDALVAGAISGKIVSFPTDTVPALATRPDHSELIFIAKQRSQDKPLILMGDTINTLLTLLSRNPCGNGSLAAGGPNILAGCFNLGVASVRSGTQGHEPPRPDHYRTLGSPTTRSPDKSWPKLAR